MLLSNLNLHHPLWGGLNREATDLESEDLIDILGDFALHNTLPPGTVTYEEGRAQSTIDLCLVTTGLINRVVKVETTGQEATCTVHTLSSLRSSTWGVWLHLLSVILVLKPLLTSCIWRPNFLCLLADKGTMLSHILHARKSKAWLRSYGD